LDVLNLFLCNLDIFTLGQPITEKYKFLGGNTICTAKIVKCLLVNNSGINHFNNLEIHSQTPYISTDQWAQNVVAEWLYMNYTSLPVGHRKPQGQQQKADHSHQVLGVLHQPLFFSQLILSNDCEGLKSPMMM